MLILYLSKKNSENTLTSVLLYCLFLVLSVSFMELVLGGFWNFSFCTVSLCICCIFSLFFTCFIHEMIYSIRIKVFVLFNNTYQGFIRVTYSEWIDAQCTIEVFVE